MTMASGSFDDDQEDDQGIGEWADVCVAGSWGSILKRNDGLEVFVKGVSLGVFANDDDASWAIFDYCNPSRANGGDPHTRESEEPDRQPEPARIDDPFDLEAAPGSVYALEQAPPVQQPTLRLPEAPAAEKSSASVIELTLLTSDGPFTKRISLAPDGTLKKDAAGGVMSHGGAERVHLSGVSELGVLIEGLTSNQALALGTLRADLLDKVEVTTKYRLNNGVARPDLIARSNADIVYRGPAFALLDYDSKGMSAAVAAELERVDGFLGALLMVLPVLKSTALLVRRSTSAGLWNADTGKALPESDGLHTFIKVKDGTDIERFLKTLHERCWLAGFGWMIVSDAGTLLERSIVDRMVFAPSRPVFEGPPILEPPLRQKRRQAIAREGMTLDTEIVCPALTIVEQSRLDELKAKERARLAPEAAKAREAFVTTQTKKLVTRNPSMS
jgi:hypothetical protein